MSGGLPSSAGRGRGASGRRIVSCHCGARQSVGWDKHCAGPPYSFPQWTAFCTSQAIIFLPISPIFRSVTPLARVIPVISGSACLSYSTSATGTTDITVTDDARSICAGGPVGSQAQNPDHMWIGTMTLNGIHRRLATAVLLLLMAAPAYAQEYSLRGGQLFAPGRHQPLWQWAGSARRLLLLV